MVEIDLVNEVVSIVERKYGGNGFDVKQKDWTFTNRSLEYMAGWQAILDAMKYAVSEATKVLEESKTAKLEKLVDLYEAVNLKSFDKKASKK